jgi:hypothetical protein
MDICILYRRDPLTFRTCDPPDFPDVTLQINVGVGGDPKSERATAVAIVVGGWIPPEDKLNSLREGHEKRTKAAP